VVVAVKKKARMNHGTGTEGMRRGRKPGKSLEKEE